MMLPFVYAGRDLADCAMGKRLLPNLALPGSLTKEIDTECANTYPGCARTVALPVMGPRLCERRKKTFFFAEWSGL